jgi:hypothetical protein
MMNKVFLVFEKVNETLTGRTSNLLHNELFQNLAA